MSNYGLIFHLIVQKNPKRHKKHKTSPFHRSNLIFCVNIVVHLSFVIQFSITVLKIPHIVRMRYRASGSDITVLQLTSRGSHTVRRRGGVTDLRCTFSTLLFLNSRNVIALVHFIITIVESTGRISQSELCRAEP